MIDYLDLDDLEKIAIAVTGYKPPPVRDWGLLESSLARPQACVFGVEAYPSLHEKVAALLHSLVRNHALVDGNKRLGYVAAKQMYGLNGYHLKPPSPEAGDEFIRAVAQGDLEVGYSAPPLDTGTTPLS
ncbi:type II toxin-antitoxin system death-on-curing family toxin [Glycomyces luteolus]|uniref:Type II toxin-antitoxin system death-on-curing family toxin n=1 Tax=Glycomyces luteolus TaxID=2670330 RepID=A0A9X3P910_9ACTN|nr:type II toxin-antitoxin system death-on-curing family toxin [Glycomyces luteolus]MDA1359168.1 type II toxin-antitoxin system death-on-curing family toxin [Glycomyces luteolus]